MYVTTYWNYSDIYDNNVEIIPDVWQIMEIPQLMYRNDAFIGDKFCWCHSVCIRTWAFVQL